MTVATTTNSIPYPLPAGTSTIGNVYTYPFRILLATDLVVTATSLLTGFVSTLILGADYTLAGVGAYTGGSVTLLTDWEGTTLQITRTAPITQATGFASQGAFFPELHEQAFDKLTMICQQQQATLTSMAAQIASLQFGQAGITTTFMGYIAGTTLTVTQLLTGALTPGQTFTGAGVLANTSIQAPGTGVGGTGTYVVNNSQTVGSSGSPILMTASGTGFVTSAGMANALASTASGQGDALIAVHGPLANEAVTTEHVINQTLTSIFRWMTAAQFASWQASPTTYDVTAIIQFAINAIGAVGGGCLFFPAGTYLVSYAITSPAGVSFLGTGVGSRIFLAPHPGSQNSYVVWTVQGNDVAFRDLHFDGNLANQYSTTANRCILVGGTGAGQGYSNVTIQNCTFEAFSQADGVVYFSSYLSLNQGCKILGNSFRNVQIEAINLCNNNDDFIIAANDISCAPTASSAIDIEPSAGTNTHIVVQGNTIRGGVNGIVLGGTATNSVGECSVIGNMISGLYGGYVTDAGILIKWAYNVKILGNEISNFNGAGACSGISVQSGASAARGIIIEANTIDGAGADSSHGAIAMAGSATYPLTGCILHGNSITNTRSGCPDISQTYSNGWSMTGNQCPASANYPLYLANCVGGVIGSGNYFNATTYDAINSDQVCDHITIEGCRLVAGRYGIQTNNWTNLNLADTNDITAATLTYVFGGTITWLKKCMRGSTAWTPGLVANGGQVTTTITVANAVVGDAVTPSYSNTLSGLALSGYVSAANTVTVVLSNMTGAGVTPAAGTVSAIAWK